MLNALGERLGVPLEPYSITVGEVTRLEVDGADESCTTIVQLVTNSGVFKSAHRNKVNADMFKLTWLKRAVFPRSRAVLCVTETVAQAFARAGWATLAAVDLGIEVLVYGNDEKLRPLFADEFTSPKRKVTLSVTATI